MDPVVAFVGALVSTVVLLVGVAWTGRRRRIRLHVPLVVLTVLGLATAIVFALRVGDLYDLESAGAITPIHLGIARVATASYFVPLVTGPLLLAGRRVHRWHHAGAYTAIVLTVLATGTGVAMLALAERA